MIPHITGAADFLPNFGALGETAFKFDFSYVAENFVNFLVIVFAFLFVDLFDTVGTLVGVASKGNMLDKDGRLPRVGKALMADATFHGNFQSLEIEGLDAAWTTGGLELVVIKGDLAAGIT